MPSASGLIPYDTTLHLDQQILEQTKQLAKVFKTPAGLPFEHTDTQILLMAIIVGRVYPRVQVVLPTQYGKSDDVGQAVLLRASSRPERWAIVAPQKQKSEIIMSYIIQHIFDNEYFKSQLIFDEPIDKLKQHRSKHHLTFKGGGEIMVLSADARNRQRTKEALMGFGSPNIVLDEGALIDDDLYATIMRMLGGHKDNFMVKIGNPFTRGHFLRTWLSPRWRRIWIDYKTALAEGRYNPDFIDEMRDEAFFDVLYENLFPAEDEIRADGYRRLVIDALLENSFIDADLEIAKDEEGNITDRPILGIDVAAGGENKTVYVLRWPTTGFAKVLEKNSDDDLDNQADRVIAYKNQYNIGDYRIVIDDGGVGHGLGDILKNKHDILFKRVLAGSTAEENNRYFNAKAELYWRVRKWLKAEGGKLVRDEGFNEMGSIYYRQNATDKLQIEPKDKLRERGILSPDTADALMLTFVTTSTIVEDDDIYVD